MLSKAEYIVTATKVVQYELRITAPTKKEAERIAELYVKGVRGPNDIKSTIALTYMTRHSEITQMRSERVKKEKR